MVRDIIQYLNPGCQTPAGATTAVWISNRGGFSKCFLTAHSSAARMSESRYFSGKVGGTWISKSISSTMPETGLCVDALHNSNASRSQAALSTKSEDIYARTRPDGRKEELER